MAKPKLKPKAPSTKVVPEAPPPRVAMPSGDRACRRCKGTGVDPGTAAPPEATVSPRTCPHPITRRIGDQCAACGATLKASDRRFGR